MGNDMQVENPILVVGGTGKTGRRVAGRLAARGRAVRIGSRSGAPAFDWAYPGTWGAAVDGVRSAYLTYYPDLAFPGAVEAIAEFSEVAVKAGVERLVLLSGRGEEAAERAEGVVRDSGAAWSVVRCSWFNQNFSEAFLVDSVLDGRIALPAGDAVEPFVDADDIADVVVAALTEPGHDGEVYELTGPRALGFAEVAAELSAATGREIGYTPLTAAQFAAVLREHGLPEDFGELFTLILDGRNAHPADGVQRALGRAPKDFTDYARETAATGVWSRSG
ncbi:NmrA family transcriptional regulator [Actinokineospora fastidiosa]|uniref:NmrA family transcriptional regulator n=1 Tax=Actinokineospora fastidiosa TaxID=1816 RepID=A0A918GH27_9PSEU|nr:NmrA family transcriptional regulator [Actinokineospora fastidiosa]GGS35275.1 NmrA family transcriptional regulator [Actinokineospora fastidiosa]